MDFGAKKGITVSGGEALLQIDFLIALFTKAQELGIHCTLDTCALPFRNTPRYLEKFDRLMAVTDLVLLDIKEINDERHKIVTSHTNKTILACAKYLSDIGKPVWIRHVLVPGLTDRDDDLIELGKFVKTLKMSINLRSCHTILWGNSNGVNWNSVQIGGCETTDKEQVQNAKDLMETESYQDYLKRVKG